jgi:hypothetical protein
VHHSIWAPMGDGVTSVRHRDQIWARIRSRWVTRESSRGSRGRSRDRNPRFGAFRIDPTDQMYSPQRPVRPPLLIQNLPLSGSYVTDGVCFTIVVVVSSL